MSGKIYKLIGYGLTYFGSTKSSLGTRKSKHIYDYKAFLSGKKGYITAYDILEKGNDWDIEFIEDVLDETLLTRREGFYIQNNTCVNKYVAGRTKKEYYEDNEEKIKAYKAQYAVDNREKINARYHLNKVAINEKRCISQNNPAFKAKKSAQDKLYRAANAEKVKDRKKEKVVCLHCQKEYTKSNLQRHIKTQH